MIPPRIRIPSRLDPENADHLADQRRQSRLDSEEPLSGGNLPASEPTRSPGTRWTASPEGKGKGKGKPLRRYPDKPLPWGACQTPPFPPLDRIFKDLQEYGYPNAGIADFLLISRTTFTSILHGNSSRLPLASALRLKALYLHTFKEFPWY